MLVWQRHRSVASIRYHRYILDIVCRNMAVDLSDMRKPYLASQDAMLEKDLQTLDPMQLFDKWFEFGKEMSDSFEEANAISLSTATKSGKPSTRMVLLKAFGTEGFTFFSNYESRKGKELAENPQACLMMYWPKINRSVRIEGLVEKCSAMVSEEYWQKRPFNSRSSAAISQQSQPVSNRKFLEEKVESLRLECLEKEEKVKKPENWGGYILEPDYFEFWQGQSDRLHDRLAFSKKKDNLNLEHAKQAHNGWILQRLAP